MKEVLPSALSRPPALESHRGCMLVASSESVLDHRLRNNSRGCLNPVSSLP